MVPHGGSTYYNKDSMFVNPIIYLNGNKCRPKHTNKNMVYGQPQPVVGHSCPGQTKGVKTARIKKGGGCPLPPLFFKKTSGFMFVIPCA